MKNLFLTFAIALLTPPVMHGQTTAVGDTQNPGIFNISHSRAFYTFLGEIEDPKDQWASKEGLPFGCVIQYQSSMTREVCVAFYTTHKAQFTSEYGELVSGRSIFGYDGDDMKYLKPDDLPTMIKLYEDTCLLQPGIPEHEYYTTAYIKPWDGFCDVDGERIPFRGPIAVAITDAQTNELLYLTDNYYVGDFNHNYISYVQVKPIIGDRSVTLEVSTFFNGEGEGVLLFGHFTACYLSGGMSVDVYDDGIDGIIKETRRIYLSDFIAYQKLGRVKGNSSIQKFRFELIDRKTGEPFIPDEMTVYDVSFMVIDDIKTYPTGIRSGDVRSKSGLLKKPALSSTTGMMGVPEAIELSVSDNGSALHVYGLQPSDMTCRIYDFSGKLLLSQRIHSPIQSVDISNLPKGVYIVRIDEHKQGTTKSYTRKITK